MTDEKLIELLGALEDRIKQHMDGVVDAAEERMKDYVRVQVEALETRILTEFHKWARPIEARIRGVELADGIFSERFAGLESRVATLEQHLLGGQSGGGGVKQ